MNKFILIVVGIFLTFNLFASIDNRKAIRSNWDCMDPVGNCISPDSSSDVLIEITLRFNAGENTSNLPDMFLYFEDDNSTPQTFEVPLGSIPTNSTSEIVAYTQLGIPIYKSVIDWKFYFVGRSLLGPGDYNYSFKLLDEYGSPYPIDLFPNLMSCIDPKQGWPDYEINHIDHVQEIGTKKLCSELYCPLLQSPRRLASQETILDRQLQVNPNPVRNRLTLNYTSSVNEEVQIEFLDIQGKLVEQISAEFIEGNNQTTVNLGHLPKGVYICRMRTAKEMKAVKFIKE